MERALSPLIAQARDPNASTADRHAAFAEIVREFRDLAVSCARARLHDSSLAEDAAQDAFLVAWERLGQLRDPEAFPGWIRRLVLTQCHRRLRAARLSLVSDDAVERIAAPECETVNEPTAVQLALAELAPADRLVLSLFYGSERSQAEIADWLRVPVTTIARRLAHAKRRLRQRLHDAVVNELREQRRRSANAFDMELSIRLRRVCTDDAAGIAELLNGVSASSAHRTMRDPVCAYLVEDRRGTPVAYAAARPTIFQPMFDLQLTLSESGLAGHAGDVLLMQVVEDLLARDAISLQWHAASPSVSVVEFLRARGFDVVRQAENWRLDAAHASRLVEHETASSWSFVPLPDGVASPEFFDAAVDLMTEVLSEDAASRPFLPLHPDSFRRIVRPQHVGVLAIADGTLQGLIAASKDDVVPDGRRIDVVLVRRRCRRKGLGRALLAQVAAQSPPSALRLSVPSSAAVTAWLSRCGFIQVGDDVRLERVLRKTVRVDPARLEEYVGHYVSDEGLPPITIERFSDTLMSKARDMRDVLLASSETEFFARHHHGHGRFERDEQGHVARLVYVEGAHTVVAHRRSA